MNHKRPVTITHDSIKRNTITLEHCHLDLKVNPLVHVSNVQWRLVTELGSVGPLSRLNIMNSDTITLNTCGTITQLYNTCDTIKCYDTYF